MVRAVFMMATRNDFERADSDKLEKMMKTLIQRWLRQNDTEDDVSFFLQFLFFHKILFLNIFFSTFEIFDYLTKTHGKYVLF